MSDSPSWDELKQSVYKRWKCIWIQTHPVEVGESAWNALFTGGKEIRARLFCDLWSFLTPTNDPPCAALAFAWECIHVASLVLDDTPWMDNAEYRRGKPTMHRMFSEKKALLLAHDVLRMMHQIWNENCPSHLTPVQWNTHLYRLLERLAIGQWYDLERRGSLVELASLKTGTLFEGVAETVAIWLGLDTSYWSTWGNRLGILFQWADDWDDRIEDAEKVNRNAFHEAYDHTLLNYTRLWSRIQRDVGSSWFDRPFGARMNRYFTKEELFVEAAAHCPTTPFLCSLRDWQLDLSQPFLYEGEKEQTLSESYKKEIPLFRGTDLIHHLLSILRRTLSHSSTSNPYLVTHLWELPEEEWAHLPEIMEWLHYIEGAAAAAEAEAEAEAGR